MYSPSYSDLSNSEFNLQDIIISVSFSVSEALNKRLLNNSAFSSQSRNTAPCQWFNHALIQ